ncbi:MAG: electron transfer flavoprotein subunit alpha/FixB family protein, partial [Ignavibacterium sp.]|nr:electron transfer flavoprotein subunit alpha/FixB family protein [Ignavibacterium sp.]
MANKILAILEQREGSLKKVSYEVASVASKLAKELNLEVEAVVVGNDVNDLNNISKYGIQKIIHLKNSEF